MSMKSLYQRWIDHRYARAAHKYNVLTEYLNGLDQDRWADEFVLATGMRQTQANKVSRLYPKTTQYRLDIVDSVYPAS